MEGSLATMLLLEVLELINSNRKSGLLQVETELPPGAALPGGRGGRW